MSKVLSIMSVKGGVGKTTFASNIAAGLAQNNKKVLIIDLDPQGNVSEKFLGRKKFQLTGISEVMRGREKITDCIYESDIKNLYVLPSRFELNNVVVELSSKAGLAATPVQYTLKEAIKNIINDYDYIIIDTNPTVNMLTVNALYISDLILVPVTPTADALEGMVYTINNLNDLITMAQLFNTKLSIIKNKVDISERRITTQILNQEIEKYKENFYVFETSIRNSEATIDNSSFNGKLAINSDNKISEDLKKLIIEIERMA